MNMVKLKERAKRLIIKQSITEAAIIITVIGALSRVIGFLREMMIAAFFGAKKFTDSYVVASAIPGILAGLVSGALASVFIPIYAELNEKKGRDEAEKFARIIFYDLLLILIIITAISYLISPAIISILAPGFNEETKSLTINFTYIMLPAIIFWGTYGIITGFYNSRKSFVIPNIAGITGSIFYIVLIFLFHNKIGAYILSWGYLVNVIVQYFLLIPFLKKIGFNLKIEIGFKNEGFKKALHLIIPIFIGQSIGILNMAVDRIFGSYLPEGSISALNYASRIYQLPLNLFVNALATAIYTDLSFNAQSEDLSQFKNSLEKGLRAVLFFTIPSTLGFIFLAKPIVQLAFERGAFDFIATKRTSESLIFYSIGLVFMAVNTILVRGFFALHDTKTPVKNSIIALLCNIILNIIFIKPLAHMGLALATSLASIISTILLYRSIKGKIEKPFSVSMKKDIGKFILGGFTISLIAFFTFNFLRNFISQGQIALAISLIISVGLAFLIYLYLGFRWKVEEAKRIFNVVRRSVEIFYGFTNIK